MNMIKLSDPDREWRFQQVARDPKRREAMAVLGRCKRHPNDCCMLVGKVKECAEAARIRGDATVSDQAEAQAAYLRHRVKAHAAYELLLTYWNGPMLRVPGMDTVIRLAVRIDAGLTPEEAAGKEYLYRWHLAVDRSRVFGAPHTLGM